MMMNARGITLSNRDILFHKGTLPFPFAKATEVNGVLYLSGQVAMTERAEPVYGSVSEQTSVIFNNIASTLISLGSDLSRVYKVTVWLSDMAYFRSLIRNMLAGLLAIIRHDLLSLPHSLLILMLKLRSRR